MEVIGTEPLTIQNHSTYFDRSYVTRPLKYKKSTHSLITMF